MTKKVQRPFTELEIKTLQEFWRQNTHKEFANLFDRPVHAIRNKLWSMGLVSREKFWTQDEIDYLVKSYSQVPNGMQFDLEPIAKNLGRLKSNVSRKAKSLGLTFLGRKKTEQQKLARKKALPDDLFIQKSNFMKEWHKKNKHPMEGKKHSKETKEKLSIAQRTRATFETEDQKNERVMKALITKRNKPAGSIAPNVKRGSWASGWREIGGYKKYYRSRWEANYARYLEWLKEKNQIQSWQHEPQTFWFLEIKRGVRSYLPDFKVIENNGDVVFHEVKGWMDARSKTCLSRMKKYHPNVKIQLIEKKQYAEIGRKVGPMIKDWEMGSRSEW